MGTCRAPCDWNIPWLDKSTSSAKRGENRFCENQKRETSRKRGGMFLTVKMKDTVLTSIPAPIRLAAGLFPGSRIARDFEGLSLPTSSQLSITSLRQRAAAFSCTLPFSDATLAVCQRFCESGHSGSTSTRMSDRSQRTFTFGLPRVSASSGWRRPSVWLATGGCGPTTYDALNSWFLSIKTY